MEKPLSGKQLLRKASSKIAASAFLESYQEHIRENYPEAVEALDKWSAGKSAPGPTVETIKNVVATHLLEAMKRKANEDIEKAIARGNGRAAKSSSGESGTGRYACQFFVKNTIERTSESNIDLYTDKDGIHTFYVDTYQDAQNLVDRKQCDMTHAVHATITNKVGKEITTIIRRDDSIARRMKQPKGPAVLNRGTGLSKSLKSFMSCKQDTASFSRG